QRQEIGRRRIGELAPRRKERGCICRLCGRDGRRAGAGADGGSRAAPTQAVESNRAAHGSSPAGPDDGERLAGPTQSARISRAVSGILTGLLGVPSVLLAPRRVAQVCLLQGPAPTGAEEAACLPFPLTGRVPAFYTGCPSVSRLPAGAFFHVCRGVGRWGRFASAVVPLGPGAAGWKIPSQAGFAWWSAVVEWGCESRAGWWPF